MHKIAKIFMNGSSQAVRLPAEFRFDAKEVFIRRDPVTGDVILSRRPNDWTAFLEAVKGADVPPDFLGCSERAQGAVERDPFDAWKETD
ncbi:antitoxin [Massilia glaciei]|uniref:AbrB/MazE/SpoVT family DNA-binding domain-containing protein n=1 Tax=Massilia glaciei TaxID=1524097 RepID=A0A2U2HIV0_9BURK|nr:AbrB/MazE/SpoVT family DNA-binding domain-containing protein [Massilia glaciei]PWF46746.1 AbrB/MazE/SpoVT family DNA-binding domain-containing protein [Massilia glaciei]